MAAAAHPGRIVADPTMCAGFPVVPGTGLRLAFHSGIAADRRSGAAMLANHPRLAMADLAACVAAVRAVPAGKRICPGAAGWPDS
jgi:uncharacterized protein (DUF433 family)